MNLPSASGTTAAQRVPRESHADPSSVAASSKDWENLTLVLSWVVYSVQLVSWELLIYCSEGTYQALNDT